MVFTAQRTRELILITGNKAGVGHRVFQAVSGGGVDTIAFHGYTHGRKVVLTLITGDNSKARRLLKKAGFEVETRDVILVDCPNRPGVFEKVTGKLDFAGIGIDYAYATTTSKRRGSIVLNTEDNRKALKVLVEQNS